MTAERSGATRNGAASAALVLGIASLPGALTIILGILLGLAAIVTGFFGVARSHQLDGAGEGHAVAGVITGMFGLALGGGLGMFLN